MKNQLKKNHQSSIIDKAITSAMFVMSIIVAFSVKEDMYLPVFLGALVVIGLRATKKVLDD